MPCIYGCIVLLAAAWVSGAAAGAIAAIACVNAVNRRGGSDG